MKNGLGADRFSSPRFLANAWKLPCPVLADAIDVLFQEANESVPEVAGKEVATLRQQLFKAGAVVETSVRRIWIHFSSHWPHRSLFVRICEAVDRYLAGFLSEPTANRPAARPALARLTSSIRSLKRHRRSPCAPNQPKPSSSPPQ